MNVLGSHVSFRVLARGAVLAIGLAAAPLAFAAGGDSNDNQSSDKPAKTDLTTCPKGQVWDAKNKKCVEKKSGVLPDKELTAYAFALAKAERYDEALDTLDSLKDPNTATALNYRGYVTRKLGRTEEGIHYYLQSVALDPNYAQVREYLGEAYLIQGKYDLAKDQLAVIRKLCGSTECEAYEVLSDAIEKSRGL